MGIKEHEYHNAAASVRLEKRTEEPVGIMMKLEDFEKALNYHGELIDTLSAKLAPILCLTDDNNKAGAGPLNARPSPASESIARLNSILATQSASLHNLLGRIDL
jgi:hypothetical protein